MIKIRKWLPRGGSVGKWRELIRGRDRVSKAKEMFNITFWEVTMRVYITVKPIRLRIENLYILLY